MRLIIDGSSGEIATRSRDQPHSRACLLKRREVNAAHYETLRRARVECRRELLDSKPPFPPCASAGTRRAAPRCRESEARPSNPFPHASERGGATAVFSVFRLHRLASLPSSAARGGPQTGGDQKKAGRIPRRRHSRSHHFRCPAVSAGGGQSRNRFSRQKSRLGPPCPRSRCSRTT